MTPPVNSATSQPASPLTSSREASQQTVAPASQTEVTSAQATQSPPPEAQSTAPAVSVSERAAAGQLLAKGTVSPLPEAAAAIQEVARQIAAGIYKPPPAAVAKALVRYEARILKGD